MQPWVKPVKGICGYPHGVNQLTSRKMNLPSPPFLVISDRHQARRPLEAIAGAAFRGGCRWFSLREKDLPPEERRALLGALVALGHRFRAVVTAHEDVEAVVSADAGGVHL